MPIKSQAQLDAFRDVALKQGYDQAEVDSFMTMATAANTQKQIQEDQDRQQELTDYESKLKLQQQYSNTSSPAATLDKPSSSGQSYLQDVTDDKGNFVDIIRNNPGISEEEILSLARANVNKYGPFKESSEELRQMGLGIVADAGLTSESVKDPLQWVTENHAENLLTLGTGEERENQAAAIMASGSVENYLKSAPLPQLLNAKEDEARNTATEALNSASQLRAMIEEDSNIEGVGPGGRFKRDWMLGSEGTSARQYITQLTAKAMQNISGKVISDKELTRLSKAFPQVGDTEANILVKSKNIEDALSIGMQMQEISKRERLTLDQAYLKYGAQAFRDKGQTVPEWIANNPGMNLGNQDSGNRPGLDIGNNNDLMDKYWK